MPRSIWTGSISFGLVNVPVKLFAAVQDRDVRFHQFDGRSGERVRQKRVAGEDEHEVPYEQVEKGYEVRDGQYVLVTREELEAVEPGRSRTIDIEDFVDLEEIDPVQFQSTYYLAPAEGAEKPYALLRQVMAEANRIAIARFVMRTKQYLAAIRPMDELLVLETMHFPDEVRDPHTAVENYPKHVDVSAREIDAAMRLVESLTAKWDPDRYHDTYRERVLELIDRKAKGEEIVVEKRDTLAPVVDLMAALEASVEQARRGRGDGAPAHTGDRVAESRTASPARSGSDEEDYESLSREELYDRAQRRKVPGCSKMSREELVEALRRAS